MDKPIKSETEQIQFYSQSLKKFEEAAHRIGKNKVCYNIAGTKVCLNFAGNVLMSLLTPALEHLKISETVNCDVTINAWDTFSSGVQMVPPPCTWADFTDRGDIWGFSSKRIKTAFHWSEYSVNVFDMATNTGVYWVKNPAAFPYWVYSSPFRTLIHWWMEKNNCQLLHAAAVGTENGAVLITGKGGTGKSTSGLACLDGGMKYLGDDYIIVSNEPKPMVYSLYNTAKLNVSDLYRFPMLKTLTANRVKEDQEKDVLYLYPGLKNQIVNEMPLKAILTPQIQPSETTDIEPASFWPVQRAMSFTTMSQLPGVGSHTQDFIARFISKLPCYVLKPGSNLRLIPETISRFLEKPAEFSTGISAGAAESNHPMISVVVPVHNGAKFIQQAIDNILSQNYPAIEIIVVDDGSTDNSREVIENLKMDVRYFFQPNSGPAAARNRGIKDVSGEYVAFLDVDDLWPERNLVTLMEVLQGEPELDLVRGYAQLFRDHENGDRELLGNPRESFPDYIGAGLYRKSAFGKVGLYDPELRFGEDGDWFNRASEKKINMKRLDEVTLLVQRHDGNMTRGKNLVELNAVKVLKKKIDRKRHGLDEQEESKAEETAVIKPSVSVVIPVYNGGAFVSDAINSVFDQDYKPLEVIVVDDGSTDNTAERVQMTGKSVKYVFQDNKGPASARNAGISLAAGKYLAFVDADDLWAEKKLDRQVEILEKNPGIGAVVGFTYRMQMSHDLQEARTRAKDGSIFLLSLGASLFRKSMFDKVGKLDEDLKISEDIDWFLRAREAEMQIIIQKDVVQYYRMHGKNLSNNQLLVNSSLLKIHKKSLDRRRKAGKSEAFTLPKLNSVEDVMQFWQSA